MRLALEKSLFALKTKYPMHARDRQNHLPDISRASWKGRLELDARGTGSVDRKVLQAGRKNALTSGSREQVERAFPLAQRVCAEFLGDTFLLTAVVGSGIMGERLSGGNGSFADQCRKWRMPVKTMAMPRRSAAAITSLSRTEPPG